MCTCKHIYIYTYTCDTYMCIYIYIYTCDTYICIYIHIYVCMYIHICFNVRILANYQHEEAHSQCQVLEVQR